MSSCPFTYETPDGVTRESDLFKDLEAKFINFPGKAEEIINLVHGGTREFKDLYGDWEIDPENFKRIHEDNFKGKVFYEYDKPGTLGLTDDQKIFGEPHINIVLDWWDNIGKQRYSHNTGRFENVGSAAEAALLKIASQLEILIEKLKRDKTQTEKRAEVRTQVDDLKKALEKSSQVEAARGLLQYALNAIKITADIRQTLEDVAARVDGMVTTLESQDKDTNEAYDSTTAGKVQKIYEFVNGYNESGKLLTIIKKEEKENANITEEERAKNKNLITGGLTKKERAELIAALELIEAERTSIEASYEALAEDFVVSKFNMKEEEMIQWHIETFTKAFKKKFPKNKQGKNEKKEDWEKRKGQSREEYEREMNKYVNEKLEDAKSFIKDRADSIFRNLLHTTNRDISTVHRWFLSAMNAPSPLLRAIQKEISVMEDNIRRDWMDDVNAYDLAYRALLAYEKKEGNAEKNLNDFWNWMMDTNEQGEITGYFLHQYSGEWHNKMAAARKSIFSDDTLSYSEKNHKFNIWKFGSDYNGNIVEGHILYNFKVPGDSTNYQEMHRIKYDHAQSTGEWGAYNVFIDELRQLHRENGSLLEIPNPAAYKKEELEKFKSKKYEELMALPADHPRRVYYKKYMEKNAENDRLLPSSFRLGYKMPSMRKSLAERFYDIDGRPWKFFGTSTGSFYKEIIKPWSKETVDYAPGEVSERGEERGIEEDKKILTVDSKHKERQFIPIHYRGEIDIEDLTRDLHGSLLKNSYVSRGHTYMSQMLPYVEMLLHFMDPARHDTFQDQGGTKLFGKGAIGRLLVKDGSNTYAAAKDLIETRMYGITMIDPGWEFDIKGQKIKGIKLLKLMQSYISTTLLSGNYHSSWANANLGNTMNMIEAVGGEFFDVVALGQAGTAYMSDIHNQLLDISERKDRHSRVNLLNDRFDPLNNFYHGRYSYAHNARLANFMKNSSLHFLNNMVEHEVQSITLIAYLKSVYVKDKDGKYITPKGKTSESRKDAMTLYDALKKRDGALNLNDRVHFVERRVGELYITENYNDKKSQGVVDGKITLLVQKLNEELQGAYSIRNSAPLQRTWFGMLAYHLKKFVWPGYHRRLGLIGRVFTNYAPIFGRYAKGELREGYTEEQESDNTRQFEPMTGTIRDNAIYGGFLKFIFKSMTDLRRLKWQVASENWSELTRNQKASIKKTLTELTLIMLLPMLSGALKDAADEDDDELSDYYTYSFLSYRLYSELAMYLNPKEAMRILQNPTVTISFIERIYNLFGQIGSDVWGLEMEEYKSGSRKGDYKVMKNFYDLVPFYKHATRHKLMSDVINYYYRD